MPESRWRKPVFSDLDDASILKQYVTKPKAEKSPREVMPSSYRRVPVRPTAENRAKVTSYRRIRE